MKPLTSPEVRAALAGIPAWRRTGKSIQRVFEFADFKAAMKFVRAVARVAEQVQHHPDIDIRWNQVRLCLTTHDAGGLTARDFELARRLDSLAG